MKKELQISHCKIHSIMWKINSIHLKYNYILKIVKSPITYVQRRCRRQRSGSWSCWVPRWVVKLLRHLKELSSYLWTPEWSWPPRIHSFKDTETRWKQATGRCADGFTDDGHLILRESVDDGAKETGSIETWSHDVDLKDNVTHQLCDHSVK